VTADGRRAAQFEHTLVVGKHGAEVLTLRADGKPGWVP
jgi:methionine aminopeptidase